MPAQSLSGTGASSQKPFRSVGNENRNQELTKTRVANPRFASIQSREASFHNQKQMVITTKEAIEAGFYHTGHIGLVRCYHCDVGLKSWKKGDDPMKEHVSHSPQCQYVLLTKGEDYIRKAGRTLDKLSNDEWKEKCKAQEIEYAISHEESRKKIEQLQKEIDLLRVQLEIQPLQERVVEQVQIRHEEDVDGNHNINSGNRTSQECQDTGMGELAMARSPFNNKRDETSPDDLTSPKVMVTDENQDVELEGAVGGGILKIANSIAEEAVAEQGYSEDAIKRAVARLPKERRLSYSAPDLMEILLEMEENESSIGYGPEIPNEKSDLKYPDLSFSLLK